MPASFLFYDLETFGADPRTSRIAQFAAIRTDADLNQVDEAISIFVRPADDLLPSPYASTSTEAVPLSTVRSVVTNRMVAEPAQYDRQTGRHPEANEAVLTIGWGAVNRLDLEPATCGDPECEGDHGYTGTMTADDFSLRMSAAADGPEAVSQLLSFAQSLSAATVTR